MDLVPVESSNVEAVGYLAHDRVLLVRYHDGSLYARMDVSPAQHIGLESAPSKGRFIAAMTNRTVFLGKEVSQQTITPNGGGEPGRIQPPPINSIDEEASACCRRQMRRVFTGVPEKYFTSSAIVCEQCGTRFEPEMVGPLRFWRIKPLAMVLR